MAKEEEEGEKREGGGEEQGQERGGDRERKASKFCSGDASVVLSGEVLA